MTDGIQTFMDCPDRIKRFVAGVMFEGCIWDRMGWSTCKEICDKKECPKGYPI